jgi:hypothetical protein
MPDLRSEQGLSDFETGEIVRLFRGFQKSENAALDRNMPSIISAHPEMVDFGSEQGLYDFETGGIALAISRISKK